MSRIFSPIKPIGLEGIPMMSGDGAIRRVHLLLALKVVDYPEQVAATCVKSGDCPTCPTKREDLDKEPTRPYRDMDGALAALAHADDLDLTLFVELCQKLDIKPVPHPFWRDLPLVHIYRSISPDVLHQLYQGVLKYLLNWIKTAYGPNELDARCRRLPPNHNIRMFANGVTSLSRVSGQEHNYVCRILLGLIVDLDLPSGHSPVRLVRAARAILDALYFAQYPLHSDQTLALLEDSLRRFDENKQIFIDLGVRQNFNINKFHFFRRHYINAIRLYGTTDNYNTEYTERLHIDLVKDAYRATNRKDEYTQMTLWLERREKIYRHEIFLAWRLDDSPPAAQWQAAPLLHHRRIQMTKHPSRKKVSLKQLETDYGATGIRDALAEYFVQLQNPNLSRRQFQDAINDWHLPFQHVAVYHTIKFWVRDDQGFSGRTEVLDSVHVKPMRAGKHDKQIPGRFDTVLFKAGDEDGIRGEQPDA